MNSQVVLSHAFDPTTVTFGTLEKTKKGGRVVYINTTDKQRIVIQTPAMIMPFGVTPYQETGGDIQSYSIDLSFRTADTDPKVADFREKIVALDKALVDAATERSEEWFGRPMERQLIAEFYRKLLNDKNPEYPPTMKIKVGVNVSGEPAAQFFDENRNPVGIEYLGKGCTIKAICELSSVWFVNKTFGATFRLIQAAVVHKPRRLQGYAFQEEEDEVVPEEM